jgi:hypothetical protein
MTTATASPPRPHHDDGDEVMAMAPTLPFHDDGDSGDGANPLANDDGDDGNGQLVSFVPNQGLNKICLGKMSNCNCV